MKRIIIATIMLVAFTSSSKASFKVGDLYYSVLKDKPENSVEVTRVSTDASNYAGLTTVDIPSSVTYDGVTYKVLNIGGSAFEFCDDLQSITLPNTIDRIGGYAFRGCTGLKSIVIPNSVTYINVKAFLNCSGLESVTLSNSLTFLGDNAFHGCSSLKSVNIPSSLTEIESEMFSGCTAMENIVIPLSVKAVGSSAFKGCDNLSIFCEANSKPDEWKKDWNPDNCPVEWGYVGIAEDAATAVNIYAHHNVIVVENADADIYVYDATGRLVARWDVAPNASIAMLREGLYIVKVGAETKRVVVSQN